MKTFSKDQGPKTRDRRPFALRLPISLSLLLPLFLAFASSAHAQWQNATYTLHGGWNAIYLHGDANHVPIETILGAHTEVIEIWRWNPNPNPVQLGGSSLIPTANTPEWSVWTRATPNTATLASLVGQTAYLVRCSGLVTDTFLVEIPQKTLPPRSTWVRNGANLLGFPSRLSGGVYPIFSNYFATFPAAIAANTTVFKYVGGDLGPVNPLQVFSPAAERLDRNQAYWFDATLVGEFYAPIEIAPSNLDGLTYGRTGSLVTVRVRNRTAAPVTLTVSPIDSAAAPVGQEAVFARVPLTRRTFDTGSASHVESPLLSSFTQVIAPQTSVELMFGIDRGAMTGAASALYASFLRFTDSGNLMDVAIPASARAPNLAGLWVGDVAVTNVGSKTSGSTGTTTPRSFPLRVLLHVADDGTATLLSQVFLGKLAAEPHPLGLCTREVGLHAPDKATATRLVAVTMPLDTEVATGTGSVALGQTLVRTVNVFYNAPTNPFIHAYHPDHDNKDARFNAVGPGVESYTLARECSFVFTATPPSGASVLGWGATVIGGNYSETVTGLHKTPVTVSGTFELRRVSEIGAITLN